MQYNTLLSSRVNQRIAPAEGPLPRPEATGGKAPSLTKEAVFVQERHTQLAAEAPIYQFLGVVRNAIGGYDSWYYTRDLDQLSRSIPADKNLMPMTSRRSRVSRPIAAACAGLLLAVPMAGSAFDQVPAGTQPAPQRTVIVREAKASLTAAATRVTSIRGAAWNADNSPIPNARLRLRDVATGRIAATTVANDVGQFTFDRVEGGSYIIELVSETGKILTVGHTFIVAPGETVATFVRLGAKVPWFEGFFANAGSAVAASAASLGVTAIAPEHVPCASPPCSR